MNKYILTSVMLTIGSFAFASEIDVEQPQRIEREGIEWCDIWISAAPQNDKPRVLLIGDSITKGYYNTVSTQLNEKAHCARFATSACVADPAFHVQLQSMFTDYEYDVIHFNNGLHGIAYTEEEYRAGYIKALKYILKESPSSKLILVLSTPLNSETPQDHLNPRINDRNEIVQELAQMCSAEINDLHSISEGHPEYYSDAYHCKAEAIELQGKQVADQIVSLLQD